MKKVLVTLLVCLLVTNLFIGCEKAPDKEIVETAAKTEEQATGEQEETVTEKETLDVITMFADGLAVSDILREVTENFNASSDKYDAVLRFIPFDNINKQMSLAIASADIPDVICMNNPDFAAYIKMGLYEDITDKMQAWEDKDQFFAGPLEMTTYEGRNYGIPYDTNCVCLWYNKEVLDAKGVVPPTTVAELKEAVAKVTDPENNMYGLVVSAKNGEEGTYQFIPWLYGNGGTYDKINSPESAEALQMYVDMVNDGYMSEEIVTLSQGDVLNRFMSKQAAMMINGTWNIATMTNDSEFEWGVTLIPAGSSGTATVMGGKVWGIGKGSNIDGAWEYIKALADKDNMVKLAKDGGSIPNRADVAEIIKSEGDPILNVFIEQMEYAVPRGPHPRWPEISMLIYTAIGEAVTNAKPVQEALDDAQAGIDAIINED